MDLPSFNSDALSSLTKKIETNLQKPADGGTKAAPKHKSGMDRQAKAGSRTGQEKENGGELKGKKRLRNGELKDPTMKGEERGQSSSVGKNKERGSRLPKTNQGKEQLNHSQSHNSQSIGQKRAVRGQKVEDHQRTQPLDDKHGKANGTKPTYGSTNLLSMQDEILALGGTKEDIELIEGVDSESEVEGFAPKTLSSKLAQELKMLVKDLGIQKAGIEEIIEPLDENEDMKTEEVSNPNEIAVRPRKMEARSGTKGTVRLLFEPQSEWHAAQLPPLSNSTQPKATLSQNIIDGLYKQAKELLENENINYTFRNGTSSSAHQFYSTIMSSGTLSDKISALTLSVQESPVHNVRALESLVGLAKKRSRGQAVEVLGALKDLLGPGGLLPSDRKLRPFAAQPMLPRVFDSSSKNWESGSPLPVSPKGVYLISWAYEDWLKSTYFDILKIIENWCNDEVVFARGKAVDYIYELLRDKPEQEANLLRLLVNKLGDSDKKIASKTSYNILQLETSHPLMKPMIISSIESDLLFRPGQSLHAKYYAIITLNQTVLSGKEEGVAKNLLDIYFSLFAHLLTKPELPKKALSAAKLVTFNKKGEKQGGGGAGGKKAQKKLELETKNLNVDEDLREKMLSAVLTGVNRAVPFTKTDDEFFGKHLDTLFRVTHSSNFNTSIQALMLIQQLCESHQAASDRFYRTLYESVLDPRLLTSSKQAMYLNLLFRALRADPQVKRVKAFAKRLLQVIAMHQASFTCGVIYLLRELEGIFANLQTFIDQPEEDESDEAEDFRDVREEEEEDQPPRAIAIQAMSRKRTNLYDGKKREPEYSNADKSCLWELDPFLMHFHPSVTLFTTKLLTHQPMPPKPDLSMHTLIQFLDRFVYRNPKKVPNGLRGSSIMQPLAGGDTSGLLVSSRSRIGSKAPVNTDAFWKMEAGKVDVDEVFFHKYFNVMGRGKEQANKKSKKKVDQKNGNVDGDSDREVQEDEKEIWKALVVSRPEIEGSDGSDVDVDFDDLESGLGESENEVTLVEDADDGDEQSMSDLDEKAMDFGEDDDALLGSDEEVGSGLDEAFNGEVQFNSETAPAEPVEEKRGKKRRRLKNLPTFASAEDYAAMLDDDDDDADG